MSDAPSVTVLIPARNEESDIERCLRAVLAQDHPHDRMEIVFVDGGSTDGTVDVVARVLGDGDIAWRIIANPAGSTPSNLNAGLRVSTGDVICRVDARSLVPPDYVRICSTLLRDRDDVVVVGGAQVARPPQPTAVGRGIARALNNPFVMGGARYRSRSGSGPDATVYLGSFRSTELQAAGGWDERFVTNQDFELNRRLGRTGTVWFEAGIAVGYLPRADLRSLARQYHRFGRAKVDYWRRTGDGPLRRQRRLLAVPAIGGAVVLGAWAVTDRRRTVVASTSAVAFAFGLAVDAAGGAEPAEPAVRLAAVAASVAVAGGWLSGVAAALIGAVSPEGPGR